MKHVHFIGIAGSGLSAIALVLLERGVRVSGSDRQLTPLALKLQQAGAQVFAGHEAQHVQDADMVVRSSAVPEDNVEVQAALAQGIPVLKRADFLQSLLQDYQVIAVAGTHGKTTTTAMIAWLLASLEQDPGYIIGGLARNLGTNAHHGQGAQFVIEADEYDRMFHGLRPALAVVTNIEHDHPDCYPTQQDFFDAFRRFVSGISPAGVLLACTDDPGAARLFEESKTTAHFSCLSYGLGDGAHFQAVDVRPNQIGGYSFSLSVGAEARVSVALQVPGLHNVRNALAALGAIDLMGLSLTQAASALEQFTGTGRRFDLRGEVDDILLVDDYAHHPTEIRATLQAARSRYAGRRLVAVWQPHTYSRTRQLAQDFATAFGDADQVIVTGVFAAREAPPADGFTAQAVVHQMAHPAARYIQDLDSVRSALLQMLQPGDVLLVLSAGDADRLCREIMEDLKEKAR